MRIAKYPPLFGIGLDWHGQMAPTLLPPPPPAVGPLVPTNKWVVLIGIPVSAAYLTGKWSLGSASTEGMGAILWQHDWGPLQPHLPLAAPKLTPSLALLLLTSSHKYFLPSFSVQEKIDGALLAKAAGGGSPVAVSTPAFLICVEECADIGCSKSFNLPVPAICFQQVSTRWVGFNGGDFWAGVIGVITDALSALILSHFGGKLFSGNIDNKIFGLVSNMFMGFLANQFPASAGFGGGTVGLVSLMTGAAGGIAFLALPVAVLGNLAATSVGETWGSKPADAQPLPPAAATGSVPPSDASQAPALTPASPPSSATPPTQLADAGTPPPSGPPPPPPVDAGGPPAANTSSPPASTSSSADAPNSSQADPDDPSTPFGPPKP
jgi:hypothetical protein